MWRKAKHLILAVLIFALVFEEEALPEKMSTDFKLSYELDRMTNINVGVRTYDDLEYMLNRGRKGYIDKLVIWLNINF